MNTMALPVTENYQLKWDSFGTHLHGCVAASLSGDGFADVVLHTLDGHQLLAHRFILSACSQYFHQILKSHSKLTTSLPLIIVLPPEVNYKTLKILIQYMYSGEATVSKDILENVLRGGDLLKVKGLWRPREEEYGDKKLVKVHHKSDQAQTRPHSKTHSEIKKSEKEPLKASSITKESFPNKIHSPALSERSKSRCENDNDSIKSTESKKTTSSDTRCETMKSSSSKSSKGEESISPEENLLQFLVIKEEPLEWNDVNEGEMELVDESEMFKAEIDIKPEVLIEEQSGEGELYSPLTCELCSETFKLPAEWVRHIQTHTDMLPAKRQRRDDSYAKEDNGTFPPLHCDMCSEYFPTPAEWVRHIQDAHTEFELHLSNNSSPGKTYTKQQQPTPNQHKVCTVCNKKFPSHASMIIHKRTHTGEKPYMCQFCCKGFNVKSNLLRHLRTLHDRIINSAEVPGNKEESN